MNKFQKVICVFLFSTSFAARAEVGLGIVLGEPTGISFRTDTSATTFIDAAVAWSLDKPTYLLLHADHLWIKPKALDGLGIVYTDLYYGVGAILALPEKDVAAALRLPIGVTHKFKEPDLELFTELAIAFTVVPDTDFDLVGGIGLRWWF